MKIDFQLKIPVLNQIKTKLDRRSFLTNKNYCSEIDEIIELVDLFATVAELAELPIPLCPGTGSQKINLCSEGLSFVPLIKAARQCKVYMAYVNQRTCCVFFHK